MIALRRRRWAGAAHGRAAARLDARRRDLDDGRARQRRRPVPSEPAGPAELGRRAGARAARDLRRPGDPRPVRRAADRVLEPFDQARHEPRRHRARARARPRRRISSTPTGSCRTTRETPTSSRTAASSSMRPVAKRQGSMTLYHTGGRPWHLLDAVQQVYSDTWCPDWCAYTYFKPNQKGTLLISIGRKGYNGSYPAGQATIVVGTVRIDKHASAAAQPRVRRHAHHVVENGSSSTIAIPVPHTPVRVEVSIPNTIPPSAAGPASPRRPGRLRVQAVHGSPPALTALRRSRCRRRGRRSGRGTRRPARFAPIASSAPTAHPGHCAALWHEVRAHLDPRETSGPKIALDRRRGMIGLSEVEDELLLRVAGDTPEEGTPGPSAWSKARRQIVASTGSAADIPRSARRRT